MEPNRIPNTQCQLCGQPIYRRPEQMKRNAKTFCSHACRNKVYRNTGPRGPNPKLAMENNPAWKGGRYIEPGKGYVMVLNRAHLRARQNGYVCEHILVAENMLGRPLTASEEVHHINRDRADNRPENLKVYASHLDHSMTEHYADVAVARDAAASRKTSTDSAEV